MMTRQELLERLYQRFMNTRTYESDQPMYSYILYTDLKDLERICEQIEKTPP